MNDDILFSWDDLPNYILSTSLTRDHFTNINIVEPRWDLVKIKMKMPIGRRILVKQQYDQPIIIHYILTCTSVKKWDRYIVIFIDTEYSPYLYHISLQDMLLNNII
jgi:hypothetical protein